VKRQIAPSRVEGGRVRRVMSEGMKWMFLLVVVLVVVVLAGIWRQWDFARAIWAWEMSFARTLAPRERRRRVMGMPGPQPSSRM